LQIGERKEERNMAVAMEETTFGRVLGEFMARRGLEATPAQIVALGERSGRDGKRLLRDVQRGIPGRRGGQNLAGVADELGLTERERVRLAMAYTFEDDIR
jgi:hypothetical protein